MAQLLNLQVNDFVKEQWGYIITVFARVSVLMSMRRISSSLNSAQKSFMSRARTASPPATSRPFFLVGPSHSDPERVWGCRARASKRHALHTSSGSPASLDRRDHSIRRCREKSVDL